MNKQNLALDLRIVNALSSKFTLEEVRNAHMMRQTLSVYYRPAGSDGPRRLFRGVPTAQQVEQLRLILAAAIGRTPAEYIRITGIEYTESPDRRSEVGDIHNGYERIKTYKWTTPRDTGKPLPPNSYAWRDIITGVVYFRTPWTDSQDNHEQEKVS